MRDGVQTRENIVRQAAALFNRQGFAGASMSDIMEATGLQKGGIYRHFESKEALAVAAFDFAVQQMTERFTRALDGKTNAIDRLEAIIDVFAQLHDDPPVPGGCPVLNTAIDTDDGSAVLRERARRAMDGLRELVRRTVRHGMGLAQVRQDVDADALASVLVSTLEGAVALSRLYNDGVHVERAAAHLRRHLAERVRA